jgi:hypothetical protein
MGRTVCVHSFFKKRTYAFPKRGGLSQKRGSVILKRGGIFPERGSIIQKREDSFPERGRLFLKRTSPSVNGGGENGKNTWLFTGGGTPFEKRTSVHAKRGGAEREFSSFS